MTKEKIAIVGAGLIGRAWAIVFARAGHPVTMYDNDPAATQRSHATILESLGDLQDAGLLDDTPAAIHARIRPATDLADALAGVDYVQENALEKLDLKRELFSRMDELAAPDTILASSTSAIPASAFSEHLKGRRRAIVAHPVNPPHLVPVVEIAPAPWTDPSVVERTRALQAAVGQAPITVKREIEGFILNRLQAALLMEAFRLVEDDYVSMDDLDTTLSHGLGLRWSFMGPFQTIDLNAPGGIADYAARFGEPMYRMTADPKSAPRRWSSAVVERLAQERREKLPLADHSKRQAWRDRRLMALAAHKLAMDRKDKQS